MATRSSKISELPVANSVGSNDSFYLVQANTSMQVPFSSITNAANVVLFVTGNTFPNTGTWTAGSIVWNNAPTSNGFIGWVCVSAGSPGTWTTFGPIT